MPPVSRTPMPGPRAKEAPKKFKGDPRDLNEFLAEFEQCAAFARLEDAEKCSAVLKYCGNKVKDLIVVLKAFEEGNWASLKQELILLYGSPGKTRHYCVSELEEIVAKNAKKKIRSWKVLNDYIRHFVTVGNALVSQGKLSALERDRLLWKGFHKQNQKELLPALLAAYPNHDRKIPYPEANVISVARFLFPADACGVDASDLSDSKDLGSSSSSDESSEDETSTSSSDGEARAGRKRRKGKNTVKGKSAKRLKADEDLGGVMRKLSNLKHEDPEYAVAYTRAVNQYPETASFLAKPRVGQAPQPTLVPTGPRAFDKCFYCGKPGCWRFGCELLKQDIKGGLVVQSPNGRVSFPDGSRIPRMGQSSLRDAVLAKKSNTSPSKVSSLLLTVTAEKDEPEVIPDNQSEDDTERSALLAKR
jgi:hypothetical protein